MSDQRPEQANDPETGGDQPAGVAEPEAPAHDDPDPETAAHRAENSDLDGADPSPPQPS